MKRQIKISYAGLILLVLLLVLTSCVTQDHNMDVLDGIYQGKSMQIEIKGDKWIDHDPCTKDILEMKFVRKDDCIYVYPYVPKGETMIRNVVVVYKITRVGLESSHIEDIETGERFEEHITKIVLKKYHNTH